MAYEFLKWACEVANSDLKSGKDIETLVDKAIEADLFIMDREMIGWEIQGQGEGLKENVAAFVVALAEGKNFSIQFIPDGQAGYRQMDVNNDYILFSRPDYSGFVQYILPGLKQPTEEDFKRQRERLEDAAKKYQRSQTWVENMLLEYGKAQQLYPGIDPDLMLNNHVMRFYGDVSEYARDKKCNISDLPLRTCKNCGKIFLGRLRAQIFCEKRCGEIWHGKKAYRKKVLGK